MDNQIFTEVDQELERIGSKTNSAGVYEVETRWNDGRFHFAYRTSDMPWATIPNTKIVGVLAELRRVPEHDYENTEQALSRKSLRLSIDDCI